MRSRKDPNSVKVQAILSVAKWAFIFFVGVGIFKAVVAQNTAYKLAQAKHEAQLTLEKAERETKLRLAEADRKKEQMLAEARLKEQIVEALKTENENKAVIAKAELGRADAERKAELERAAKKKLAENMASVEREIRAYFSSDDANGHRRRSESSFFLPGAAYFGEKKESAAIDSDLVAYENTWPVHLVRVDRIEVVEVREDVFDATVHLGVSRGKQRDTASPYFPIVHLFRGVMRGGDVKFAGVLNPDLANSLVARFRMRIGVRDTQNSKGVNFFELYESGKIPDASSLFKEIILMDRSNYRKGLQFRDDADEPADWFLVESTRKKDFERFRTMPLTIEPAKWSLKAGETVLEVEITNSRIAVKILQ